VKAHETPKSVVRTSRQKKGLSSIIAAIIIFGILFTVVYSFYYTGDSFLQAEQNAQENHNNNVIQQGEESLIVYGTASAGNHLYLDINNTGPAVSIVAYWIINATSKAIIQYENVSMTSKLPLNIGEGQSETYTNTNITVISIYQQYVMQVLTSRGTTAVGTYPSQVQVQSSINDLLAGAAGSLRLSFSSFSWYSYISGPSEYDNDLDYLNLCSTGASCNGGTNILNLASPQPGTLIPQGQNVSSVCSYCGTRVPIAFGVNITNSDPNGATLVINSEANLWVIEACDSVTVNSCPTPNQGVVGPQGNEMYVFYIVNVNTTSGAVTSLNQGSFTQITIPYGVTKTLYFASAYDISQQAFSYMSVSTDDSIQPGQNNAYYGEFASFILFAGTRIPPTSLSVYGQNIPFGTVISANNLGTFSETPTICTSAISTAFTLTISNSVFSGAPITQINFNATAFSSVSAYAPTGWSESVSSGQITWTNTNTNNEISPGGTQNFLWTGIAPTVTQTVQLTMPFSVEWNGKGFNYLQSSAACFDTDGLVNSPVLPIGVVDFVPITLVNYQSTPVAAGTQIMLHVNWASYSSYVDNPVNNVVVFDFTGNTLNSWMENGSASSSTNSIVWVKLGTNDAIPAYSSTTIYLGFYQLGNNVLSASGPFGEAPQLSSTYAQYDDGSSVFLAYFNGNTALSNFALNSNVNKAKATGVACGSYTCNALNITGTGTGITFVYTGTALPNEAMVVESDFKSKQLSTAQGAVSLDDNAAPGSAQNAIGVDYGYSSSFFSNANETKGSFSFDANQQGTDNSNWNFASITYTGASSWSGYIGPELYTNSGAYSGTETTDPIVSASNLYLSSLTSASSSHPDGIAFNWMRARVYPPNGVMPGVIFGSVIS
jgi:hypothetical protein